MLPHLWCRTLLPLSFWLCDEVRRILKTYIYNYIYILRTWIEHDPASLRCVCSCLSDVRRALASPHNPYDFSGRTEGYLLAAKFSCLLIPFGMFQQFISLYTILYYTVLYYTILYYTNIHACCLGTGIRGISFCQSFFSWFWSPCQYNVDRFFSAWLLS
jgi:hypothetical protein